MKAALWIAGIVLVLVVVMEAGRRTMMGTHCAKTMLTELPSPDRARTAVVVEMDCGPGERGTGVVIREGNAPFTGKEHIAFEAEGKHPVVLRWLAKDRLEVKSASVKEAEIKDLAETVGDVKIEHVRN